MGDEIKVGLVALVVIALLHAGWLALTQTNVQL